jgi:4-hydroxy-tetrahydrodipicolinate reductase
MKIAIFGNGKTGSKVKELCEKQNIAFTIFDSKNIPNINLLAGHDVIISFLASDPFESYLNLIIESKLPLISGTTGFQYSPALNKRVTEAGLKWIVANNFSLGMNLVQQMIKMMSKADLLVTNPTYKIHEVHHTKKLDAPSGTAISWQQWLGKTATISSERTGDVIGFHELTLKTSTEEIKVSHNALDRLIFAEGALWAANKILTNPTIPSGINNFQTIVEKELLK